MTSYYSDFPINFRFVKLSHHCRIINAGSLGSHLVGKRTFDGVLPPEYTRASNLIASSCLTWDKYLYLVRSGCSTGTS